MTVASRISPACSATGGRSTVTAPPSATCRIVTSVAAPTVTDRSLDRKSPASMVATWVWESADQAPILWGCFLAWFFTEAGARRSELPCRSTGFTALPVTFL